MVVEAATSTKLFPSVGPMNLFHRLTRQPEPHAFRDVAALKHAPPRQIVDDLLSRRVTEA